MTPRPTRSAIRAQGAAQERERTIAYARDYAARVERAAASGRISSADRKMISQHIRVLATDLKAGMHLEDGDGR